MFSKEEIASRIEKAILNNEVDTNDINIELAEVVAATIVENNGSLYASKEYAEEHGFDEGDYIAYAALVTNKHNEYEIAVETGEQHMPDMYTPLDFADTFGDPTSTPLATLNGVAL